jgi:hypothetical protein
MPGFPAFFIAKITLHFINIYLLTYKVSRRVKAPANLHHSNAKVANSFKADRYDRMLKVQMKGNI